ncbi:hypothetical protein JYQ62_34670 [Nostoc sp. UHCC 0702]|nr:hypothetical protein JYQ62_34670 [Nostoc sp. UHCC 0702]
MKRLKRDYEDFYSKIRDKVADHRQDLPIDELVELWNEIDNTTVNIFIDDAITIYRSMVRLNSNILPFVSSLDITNFDLKMQLVDLLDAPNISQIKISADNLAMTQTDTIAVLHINEMQERCSQIVSIFNSFNFSKNLYTVLKLGQDTQRLAKVMLVIDVFNFIDNLYPYNRSDPKHKIKSLLEICQQEELSGYEILNTAYNQRNTCAENKFREVRNQIAAHVDRNLNLNNLLALLDSTNIDELINKVWTPAYKTFKEWCYLDIVRYAYLIDETPGVAGVSEVEDLGGYKPYY